MLVLELHLPSRKDNQLSGVFNLKYSHWTMEHSAQPLHSAHIQGLDIITVLDRWAHLLCCTDVLSLQMKRLLLIQFAKVGPYRAYVFQNHNYDSSRDEEIVTACGFVWLLNRSWRAVQSSASVGVWTPAVSLSLPTPEWRPQRKKCFPRAGETGSLARGLSESRSEIKNKNKGSGKLENKYQEKRGRF